MAGTQPHGFGSARVPKGTHERKKKTKPQVVMSGLLTEMKGPDPHARRTHAHARISFEQQVVMSGLFTVTKRPCTHLTRAHARAAQTSGLVYLVCIKISFGLQVMKREWPSSEGPFSFCRSRCLASSR